MAQNYFKYSDIADNVARLTDWGPLLPNTGTTVCSYKLIQTDSGRMEYRITVRAKMLYIFLFLIGLCFIMGVILSYFIQQKFVFHSGKILLFIIGLILVGACGRIYAEGSKPIVFDKQNGLFWKSKKGLAKKDFNDLRHFDVRIEDIYALQLVSKKVGGGMDSYYCFEVNFVLKDGARLNVVDYPGFSRAKEDAQRLSSFLGIDIWDNVKTDMIC